MKQLSAFYLTKAKIGSLMRFIQTGIDGLTCLNFWKEIGRLAADASDEVLTMDDFQRMKFNRELTTFDD